MQQDNIRLLDAEILGRGVDPTLGQNEMQFLGNLVRAVRRARLWILVAVVIGGLAAYLITYLSPVKYTSEAQVMINTRISVDTAYTPVVSDLPTSTTVLESELKVLHSYDLIERIVENLQLQKDPEFSEEAETSFSLAPRALINAAKSSIKSFFLGTDAAENDEGSSLIDFDREMTIERVASQRSIEQMGNISAVYAIRFTSVNQNKAAVLANALAAEYLKMQTEAKLHSLELSQGWLAARTSEIQQELSDQGVQLEQHILSAPYSFEEVQLIRARSISAERRMQDYEVEILAANTSMQKLVELDTSHDGLLDAAEAVSNPTPELVSAVAAAKSDSEGADSNLENVLATTHQRLLMRSDQLTNIINGFQPEVDALRASLAEQAKRDSETRRIEHGILVLEAIYEDFLTQLSRRTQQDQYLDADARIISFARPSLESSEPKRSQIAIAAALLMGVFASGIAVLLELKQNRMRTAQEIEDATGLPVLGIIPEVKLGGAIHETFLANASLIESKLVRFTRKMHSSLTSKLNTMDDGISSKHSFERSTDIEGRQKNRIIAGTSTQPNEGQSTAMLFLANAFANAGERVLLMDCDFWNSPYVNLEASETPDFGTIVANPKLADDLIVNVGMSGLKFLPALRGDGKTSAQLGTADFTRLLDYLATQYDRILLDTPPLLSMMDTAPICKQADNVILFVRWNSTSRGGVASALQILHDIDVNPFAAVATRVNLQRARSYGDNSLIYTSKSYIT